MEIETLLKNTSRSLYLSVQALPAKMRPTFGIAYLLCRYADTIADTDLLPAERRLYWVKKFPTLVQTQNEAQEKQLVDEISGKTENPYEAQLITHLKPCLDIFNQIEDRQKPFILEVVKAVCEGMALDLSFFPQDRRTVKAFDNEAQLKQYCRLMGGKPGRFWSQLIFHTTPIEMDKERFYQLGEKIGDSLQIVNILRDLPKDLQLGRCYFPLTDLQQHHLTPTDLQQPQNSPAFEPIKQKWILWGKENLQNGKTYIDLLPKKNARVRAAVMWPLLWTADTFLKLAQTPDLLDVSKRVKIPRRTIYTTLLLTPVVLFSNTLFHAWLNCKLNKLA